ncbi:MAG: hypothetical protein ACKOJI_05505, partial [Phycisphaerales bacterium]
GTEGGGTMAVDRAYASFSSRMITSDDFTLTLAMGYEYGGYHWSGTSALGARGELADVAGAERERRLARRSPGIACAQRDVEPGARITFDESRRGKPFGGCRRRRRRRRRRPRARRRSCCLREHDGGGGDGHSGGS